MKRKKTNWNKKIILSSMWNEDENKNVNGSFGRLWDFFYIKQLPNLLSDANTLFAHFHLLLGNVWTVNTKTLICLHACTCTYTHTSVVTETYSLFQCAIRLWVLIFSKKKKNKNKFILQNKSQPYHNLSIILTMDERMNE